MIFLVFPFFGSFLSSLHSSSHIALHFIDVLSYVSSLQMLLLIVLFATTFAQVQLATVNPGFETGDFTGWQQFAGGDPNPNPLGKSIVMTNPAEGTFALEIDLDAASQTRFVKYTTGVGQVTPGQTLEISFFARGTPQDGSGSVALGEFFTEGLDPNDGASSQQILGGAGGTAPGDTTPLILDADPNVWTQFTYIVEVGPDAGRGVTVQFVATTGGGTGDATSATVFFDSLSIVRIDRIFATE